MFADIGSTNQGALLNLRHHGTAALNLAHHDHAPQWDWPPEPRRRKPTRQLRPRPRLPQPTQANYQVEIEIGGKDAPQAPPSRLQQIDDRITGVVLWVSIKLFRFVVLAVLLGMLVGIVSIVTLATFG